MDYESPKIKQIILSLEFSGFFIFAKSSDTEKEISLTLITLIVILHKYGSFQTRGGCQIKLGQYFFIFFTS
jgi:hypothetical protein